jgi:hypothetical protein
MRKLYLFLIVFLFFACSSAPPKPAFSDFLEIRAIADEDPLAHRFASLSGEIYRLGDPIILGRAISRIQIQQVPTGKFDMLLTLTGAEDARWRRYTRRRIGQEVALLIDGKVQTVFPIADPGEPEEDKVLVLTVPSVAESEKDAEKLEQFVERARPARKE